jgi:hypothetical protein
VYNGSKPRGRNKLGYGPTRIMLNQTRKRLKKLVALLIGSLAIGIPLTASTIEVTLPPLSIPFTFPFSPQTMGTFSFVIPSNEIVTGAFISGAFGNSQGISFVGADVFADGVDIARCPPPAAGVISLCLTEVRTPWTFAFPESEFSLLLDGSLVLTAMTEVSGPLRLDTSTLTITTSVVPEPSLVFLLTSGVAFLTLMRRRGKSRIR